MFYNTHSKQVMLVEAFSVEIGWEVEQVAEMMSGPVGEPLRLALRRRDGSKEAYTITLVRK